MSIFHQSRAGTRGGKDQFSWDTVKSDKDRECYLGHSVMAPTGRWQEGKDLNWYAKDRENEQQIKSAEFRSAKRIEEEALMAALGMKVLPPPIAPAASTQQKPVIKREPQSTSIKNEPMTPAIHNDPRNSKRHLQTKNYHSQRKEDRRRQRQLKATGSDEEKHEWSEDDADDLLDNNDDDDDDDEDKVKLAIQRNMTTEKELDDFLIDLVKKHGLKTIQRSLKPKKEKKERKRKHSSSSSSSSSAASESEEEKTETKHKHKKKHSHKEESKSSKHQKIRSSSPSSRKDRSKHHRN